VRFGILGPLEVWVGDDSVDLRRAVPRRILTVLLIRAPEPVGTSTLMDVLWGDDQPGNPTNALQTQISFLRRAFAEAEPGGSELIETRPSGYALRVAPGDIDAHQFEHLVREAALRAAEGTADALEDALERYERALALWRGDALAELADAPFAMADAVRLEEARITAAEACNDVQLALGRHRALVGPLEQMVRRHPLRERLHEQLILAMYRCGRQADALRAYERARSALVEELGLNPGPDLQRIERAVLAQDPALDWQPPPGSSVASGGRGPESAQPDPLPAPLTTLVGRDAEVARAERLLLDHRVATLTGPGGAGKSRLALEVARRWTDAEHVWFVDLGAVADPEFVAPTIAASVGVPSAPDGDTVAAVGRALLRERGLLVLDTCEHVLAEAAAVALRILSSCPGVRVLATSRHPLGITGEIAWPVPPLALPPPDSRLAGEVLAFPSVALFAERAAAVRPGFEVTDANAGDVAAICLALDGLPLAIELAAARADVLTPAAVRARLENRFDLLVDGGRQAAARQQTLRSAMAWSFELLGPEEKQFFGRLGVFAASFDLDAAIAVAGPSFADPLALLTTLVRSSMVASTGDDRFRLLDTVRAYAMGVLEPDAETTRQAHAQHYTALAEHAQRAIIGPDQLAWLDRIRADVPNFRAAIEWAFQSGDDDLAARLAGSLAWFWTLEGMLAEAVEHADRASSSRMLAPLVRAKVLCGVALLAASLGRLERARVAAAEAAALGDEAGDAFAAAFGLNAVAVVEWAAGNRDAAAEVHDRAIERLRDADEPWVLGVCLALRARTALDAGDLEMAQVAEMALKVARKSGDRHVIGLALEQIALLRLAEGKPGAAVEAARDCLAMHEAIGYTEGVVSALHVLARSLAEAGSHEDADHLHRRALALATRIGHVAAMCEAIEGLAVGAAAEGDHATAVRLISVCDAQRRRHGLASRTHDERALREARHAAEEALGAEKAADIASSAAGCELDDIVTELVEAR
jgi:predicted ATPase/DNA-binding SARP family transcriptional activator